MSVTRIPDSLREEVIALQGDHCLNPSCRVKCTHAGKYKLHIDHVIPEIMGGRTELGNLQVLCRTCNLRKGGRHIDWRLSAHLPQRQRLNSAIIRGHRLHLYTDARRMRLRYTVLCECGQRHWTAGNRDDAVLKASEHLKAMATTCPERRVYAGDAVIDLTKRLQIRNRTDLATAMRDLVAWGKPAPVTPKQAQYQRHIDAFSSRDSRGQYEVQAKPVSTYVPGGLPPKIAAIADVLTPEELERLLELEAA